MCLYRNFFDYYLKFPIIFCALIKKMLALLVKFYQGNHDFEFDWNDIILSIFEHKRFKARLFLNEFKEGKPFPWIVRYIFSQIFDYKILPAKSQRIFAYRWITPRYIFAMAIFYVHTSYTYLMQCLHTTIDYVTYLLTYYVI